MNTLLSLLFTAFMLFGIGYLIGRFKQAQNDHNVGEKRVSDLLSLKLNRENYYLLNNVTLPAGTGTTQIDHIVVSTKGIFVLETKHYSGGSLATQTQRLGHKLFIKRNLTFKIQCIKIISM